MPERVHTKFEDEEAEPSKPNTVHSRKISASSDTHFQVKPDGPLASESNGVKRFRDGSPKSTTTSDDLIADLIGVKESPKKQRASKDSNGYASSTTHPKANVSHSTTSSNSNESKKTNGIGTQKTANGLGVSKPSSSVNNPTNGGYREAQKVQKADHMSRTGPSKPSTRDLASTAAKLLEDRKKLPIWHKKADIRWSLRNNDVLLLVGETGSGKSTQVPQFLYTEPWCKKQAVKVKNKEGQEENISVGGVIAVTEPRRIAATSLARRVAREVGSCLEAPRSDYSGKVGYSVRFDSNLPAEMKIKFVTEGTLLQEMLTDPYLRQYSAVIVDEIHERSVDVDLIAGFLRQILHGDLRGRGGVPLKVVIMSATLDLGGLEAFFARPGINHTYHPGNNHQRTFAPHLLENQNGESNVEQHFNSRRSSTDSTNTFSSWGGISSSGSDGDEFMDGKFSPESDAYGHHLKVVSISEEESGIPDGDISENGVMVQYIEGRQHEVELFYRPTPTSDYMESILKTILQIHITEPLPGDILAFLTGQEEIEALRKELEFYSGKLHTDFPKVKVLPLYGSLPENAQQEAFEPVEKNIRKIVLATNIAETSVTVSGVRFVVDCGKSKVKQYRPRLGMESLLAKPISRVSAIQRKGRAGREAEGKCYRIYTEEDYLKLEMDELPEILRSDVVEAVLKMKARGVNDVLSFPLMDSPDVVAMEKALLQLHVMGALDDQGNLTNTGKKMAQYPLPATYGRVLIAAAERETDCLLEAIDVISILTADTEIFLQPQSEEEKEEMDEYRKDLYRREGDILTYLTTIQRYANENANRISWCTNRIISIRAMKSAMAIRKQLRTICYRQKLLKEMPLPDPQPFEPITPERAEVLLKTFMVAFATRTAVLAPDGSYLTTHGRNVISIHPSSVLHGQKKEAIMFLEHVWTAKNYAKKVSAIQANWIVEALEM